MLPEHRNSYSSHRAACKQWSAGLGVLILLIGALAGLNPTKMLWAAGPLLLLGLVEAGYAAQERRYAELLKAKKISEETGALPSEPASASVVRTTLAALSLSIWPFYLGLFAIVGIGGEQMAASNKKMLANYVPASFAPAGMVRPVAANGVSLVPSTSLTAGCGAGGCGTSAGCGSGGCGASAGQGCSCGAGGTAPTQQMKRPVQPYGQITSGPMAYQGGYPPMPQGQTMPRPGQTMPQQAQYQRLPNGAIVNARPPNMAANASPQGTGTSPALQGAGTSPALVRAMPGAGPGQPVPAAPPSAPSAVIDTRSTNSNLPSPNSAPPPAPSAVVDTQSANSALPSPNSATPAAAPPPKPATPDAASKKR